MPVERLWGTYEVLHESPNFKVKVLRVNPKSMTSIQKHKHRSEVWVFKDGRTEFHPKNQWHQLNNPTEEIMEVIEIQTGAYFGEDDILRSEGAV